jgi:GDP-mannose pyrophosphatase NudK
VKEETGYDIELPEKIGAVYSSAGGITEYIHLFISKFDSTAPKDDGGGLESEGEDIQLVTMSFDEAKQMLDRGSIRDAKTMILLQHYFLQYLAK